MEGDNPFLKMGGTAPPPAAPQNPFLSMSGGTAVAEPEDDTAIKRLLAQRQSIEQTIMKLKSTVPKNEGHKARLDRLVKSLEVQLETGGYQGQSAGENIHRGLSAGAARGFEMPVKLAGMAGRLLGHPGLSNYIKENEALIEEDVHPRGFAGSAGEFVGELGASAPAFGAGAKATGSLISAIAPSSRLAAAIEAGYASSRLGGAATNVATGLPINALMAAGEEGIPIPDDATPEEADRIRSQNTALKLKQLAIGIGADALFGAALHFKKPGARPVDPAAPPPTLTPERQAQLDQVKAQNAVKVATRRTQRINKARAQSEWQIMNPDTEWKELKPEVKKKIYADWSERQSNSNPNTSTSGLAPEQQQQLVAMEERLKQISSERDEAARQAETDPGLNIGNQRALEKARVKADADPGTAYVFFDVNGLKGINDGLGMQAGDELLRNSVADVVSAHQKYGINPRLFRYGGDELVAIVPKEHAQTILDTAERASIRQYGEQTGSLSGAIHTTLDDALSIEGKAALTSRKIEAKARQGIAGRDAQEQSLIDEVRLRQNTQPAPVAPPEAVAAPEYQDPWPPEAMVVIDELTRAGGLQSEEARQSLVQELVSIYNKKNLSKEDLGKELQALIEDFTPLEPHSSEIPSDEEVAKLLSEEPAAPNGKPAEAQTQTNLESVEHKKPLEQLSDKQLDVLDDKVLAAIEDVDKKSPEYAVLQRDLDAIANEHARRKGVAQKAAPTALSEPVVPERYSDMTVQRVVGGMKQKEATTVIDKALVRLRGMSPRKMTDGELELHIRDLENERRNLTAPDEQVEVQKKLDKVLQERAFREKAKSGPVAQVPPSAAQSMAGFLFGVSQPVSPDASEEQKKADRITNGLLWAGVAVVGMGVASRMKLRSNAVDAARPVVSDRWLGSDVAEAKIVNRSEIEPTPKAWMERMRDWYTGIVRRSYGIDRATETLGGSKLAASKNPAKLISMFGRWVSQSEGAMMDKPMYVDIQGNPQALDAISVREIAALVDEDTKGLGKLMTARASVEGEGLRKVPFDNVTADLIIKSAQENYHRAADEARKFSLAMATVLEKSGVLTPGSVERFAQEEFYAALHKVFNPDGQAPKLVRDPKSGKVIISPNPIKGRKGGHTGQVYNPFETMVSMVPQIYRSAELATIKNRLIDLWEAAGRPKGLIEQIERRKTVLSAEQQIRIDALKQEVKGLSQADAEHLVAAFDPKSLDPRSNIMTVHREGVIRSYRVDEHIAQAMASLHTDELEGIWKILGMPAGVAKAGVVLNPYFVAKQAFIDNWQATLNSQYGFRFGIDQFLGWWNIVRHTPEYKNFLAAGGGHSTLQSGEFTNVKSALGRIRSGTSGPLETAIGNLKEFKAVDAYKHLIVPFSEAARVGEYLRARGHGASVLDGVYAAKHVTANFQQRGGFQIIRGLDRASMFLNPALQGLDQAAFRAGINPFRAPEEGRSAAAAKYLSKAFVTIALPSMYFWSANKDDQEITDLRKTTTGAKYWFFRSPTDVPKMGVSKGDIIKIPKPIVDGQLFGTSMEAAMDKMYQDDPESVHRTVEAMARDIGFNVLPTMGVLYYGLQTGKNLGTGGNLIPARDENLAPEHQGEDKASWLARSVSRAAQPLLPDNGPDILRNATTPAGLDYVLNTVGGMLGQDALTVLTQAVEAESKGYVPAKEELPLISKVFASYPSANVEPIRTFYDRAEKTQEVQATIKHLLREDPERLATYMLSNQHDMMLIGLYDKSRQAIANYSKAIQDLEDAPAGTMTSEDKRMYKKQYLTLMIETARQANLFAREVDRVKDDTRSASPTASRR